MRKISFLNIVLFLTYGIIAILFFLLYYLPILSMMKNWEHEYLLVLISLLLIYWKRKEILAVEKERNWQGLIIIAGSLLFFLVAKRGDINALIYASFIPFIFGTILYLGGNRLASIVTFPIFFLLFTVRAGFVNIVLSVKLRIFSTIVSTTVVNTLGIVAQRIGTYVYTPDVQYDIASPCSGLNSLNTLIPLSFLFAYLTQKKLWRRAVIVVMAVPIALAGNASRIVGIALAARGFGAKFALKAFHDWSGYFIFGFGLVCLFGIGHVLGKIPEKAKGAKAPASGEHKGTEKQKAESRKRILLHLGIIIGLLCLTFVGVKVTEKTRYFSKGLNFSVVPLQVGEWKGEDIEINEKEIESLPSDTEHFKRKYTREGDSIFLAIVQSKADRRSIHPPEACFPAQGWSIGAPTPFKVDVGGGKVITINKFQAKFRGYREIIIYWYQTEAMMITKYPLIPFITAKDLILYGRNDRWAFIRLSSPVGEKAEETEERMKDFILDLWKYVQYED